MDTFGGKDTRKEILFFAVFAAIIIFFTLGILGFAFWVVLS